MSREKKDYRSNLEYLLNKFPGKDYLTAKEVADYLGVDIRTLKNDPECPIKKIGRRLIIPITNFASYLS